MERAARPTATCSSNETGASMRTLRYDQSEAMRWMFERNVDGSGRLSLAMALRLLHKMRAAWRVHKMDAKFHNLARACGAIDGDGSLTLPELTWVIWALDPEHFNRAALIHAAELEATRVVAEAKATGRRPSVCLPPSLLESPLAAIEETRGKRWRYYTAFPCSGPSRSGPVEPGEVCLTFKPSASSTAINGLRLGRGGVQFIEGSYDRDIVHFPWDERMFVHNVATLQLPDDQFVMVGGMEGFTSRGSGCRRGATCSGTKPSR